MEPLVLANRAALLFEAGRLDAALLDLDGAVALEPELPELYRRRALVHERLGHAEARQRDLAHARRLESPAAGTATA